MSPLLSYGEGEVFFASMEVLNGCQGFAVFGVALEKPMVHGVGGFCKLGLGIGN